MAATRPAKGTPEWDLWIAAIEVAMAAPERRGQYSSSALIYWPKIEALRAALDVLGIDWHAAKREADAHDRPR